MKIPLTRLLVGYELTTLGVYLLGGTKKAVDTEDVAVKCHEIAPGTFAWRKYPDQINLELVRVQLSDAKKKKNGTLLSGSGREGWRITTEGLKWISTEGLSLLEQSGHLTSARKRTAGSIDTVRRDREVVRLCATEAWFAWKDGKSVSIRQVEEVFRVDVYTNPEMLERKVVRLTELMSSEPDISEFINILGPRLLEARKNNG